jgi:hypothetical protein
MPIADFRGWLISLGAYAATVMDDEITKNEFEKLLQETLVNPEIRDVDTMLVYVNQILIHDSYSN